MSLNKEALEHLGDLVASSLSAPDTFFNKIILPSGVKVDDLEKYQKCRNQFRGEMKTESITDFTDYCNLQTAGSCFINRENMAANTIFDIGTELDPGHCKHTSFLKLRKTAAFVAMNSMVDKRLSQQSLAEFIEDWRDKVMLSDENHETIGGSAAISAVRKITIKATSDSEHNTGSFSESTSSMDKLDASSGEKNLPAYLDFSCESHYGLKERGFSMRVGLIITGDKPQFILRPIKFDVTMKEASDEFQALINKSLEKKVTSHMGFFNPGD